MFLRIGTAAAVSAAFFCLSGSSGAQVPRPDGAPDEIVRVNTELVQTAVTVLDRQGRFVGGLTKGDFELKIDGRAVPISFFENITSGGVRDRAARPAESQVSAANIPQVERVNRRTIVFFLDDLHLSLSSIDRTRQMLLGFIDKQMGDNDQVGIASASGKIGFLQQFTDDKDVLRAAVARIGFVPYAMGDTSGASSVPMTEYIALTIERMDDPRVFDYYVQECAAKRMAAPDRAARVASREACKVEVRNRARSVVQQAGAITDGLYTSFEGLLATAARRPGSKLAFFISDGFLAESGPRGRISSDKITEIAAKARRAGVVIYTIDASGLTSGAADATGSTPLDPDGLLETANLRAIAAAQDPLNALAADTGGRALRNQNYFEPFVTEAVRETSQYYLIAWEPEGGNAKNEKSKKIEVTVVGRPELSIRAGKGFLRAASASSSTGRPPATGTKDADLKLALSDTVSTLGLPLALNVVYLDVPNSGAMITSSIEVPADSLSFGPKKSEPARVTLAGIILDDHGKAAGTFSTGINVDAVKSADRADIIYNYPVHLKPGLYQVRVAARDDRSGALGSNMQWIAVPDLSKRDLTLSSLLFDVHDVRSDDARSARSQWSVGRRFAPRPSLRIVSFVYNAASVDDGRVDVTARIQIKQDGVEVMPRTVKKITIDPQTDMARIPYVEDIDIRTLGPGRYDAILTVEDHRANKTASRRAVFFIE